MMLLTWNAWTRSKPLYTQLATWPVWKQRCGEMMTRDEVRPQISFRVVGPDSKNRWYNTEMAGLCEQKPSRLKSSATQQTRPAMRGPCLRSSKENERSQSQTCLVEFMSPTKFLPTATRCLLSHEAKCLAKNRPQLRALWPITTAVVIITFGSESRIAGAATLVSRRETIALQNSTPIISNKAHKQATAAPNHKSVVVEL